MRKLAWLLLPLVVVTTVVQGPAPPAQSQALSEGPVTSWWASPDEPPMTATEGTLRNPETVRLEFAGGKVIRGWEAVVFLLARRYVEYVVVNGRLRLRTTDKYKAWKKAKMTATGTTGGGTTASPAGSSGAQSAAGTVVHTFSVGIDEDFKRYVVDKAKAGGADLKLETTPFTVEFVAPDQIRLSPQTIRHIWQFTYANGMVDRVEAVCIQNGGNYKVLDLSNPVNMVGNWGFGLECHIVASRDGNVTSDTTSPIVVMIHYDAKAKSWILNPVGLQDAQWRVQ